MLFECVREKGREGETGVDRKRAGETGGVCVHALSWLRAGCYSSWHASPSSPRTSGARLVGERRGNGEKELVMVGRRVVTASKCSSLNVRILRFRTRHPTSLLTLPPRAHSLALSHFLSDSLAVCLRCVYMHLTGLAQAVIIHYSYALCSLKVSSVPPYRTCN